MSMQGTVALVTGATAGIGFHTARALVTLGARVVVTGRDTARGQAAARLLAGGDGHDRVRFIATDHATVAGNRALAQQLAGELDRLDVLVNNVGTSPSGQRRLTADGYEATLAVNFVGPAALTTGLLPLLRHSPPPGSSPWSPAPTPCGSATRSPTSTRSSATSASRRTRTPSC
jgi:NAD(P)-dependent dehydrogenase (short-subunit alcohol dehydrogenase family)